MRSPTRSVCHPFVPAVAMAFVVALNTLVAWNMLTLGVAAYAQPQQPAEVASPPSHSDPQATFDQQFSQWKALLKDLFDLRQRFYIAEPADVPKIRTEYVQKLEQGRQLLEKLRVSGLAALQASDQPDGQLVQFLSELARDDVNADRFEQAYEVTHALSAKGIEDAALDDVAGMAAFATSHFDEAARAWQRAQEKGTLKLGEDYLAVVSEEQKKWEREQRLRDQEAAADDLPRVRLKTTKGDIVVELFENEAPGTVGNFVSLVEKGFYDGLTFHRVLPRFMAQAGCPKGDGTGGPGYNIYCEAYQENHRDHFRGSLSMAKGREKNTGGSQFFLTFVPTYHLDGIHTVFGRVIQGMDVLADLQRRDPSDPSNLSIEPDRILKAEVIRKRDHAYRPNIVQ